MRYYSNFIGSIFGLGGGKRVIAEPTPDDYMEPVRIDILRTIADSNEIVGDALGIDMSSNVIRARKIAGYKERMLKAKGFYTGEPDFAEMREIKREMAEDWWLNNEEVSMENLSVCCDAPINDFGFCCDCKEHAE